MAASQWRFCIALDNGFPVLDLGPKLGFAKLTMSDGRPAGTIFGFPIDLTAGQIVSPEITLDAALGADETAFVSHVLNRFAGRFLWMADLNGQMRLYTDPTASVPCVFHSEKQVAGLTANEVLGEHAAKELHDASMVSELLLEREGWLAAGVTTHDGLSRLLPNQYLDLQTWRMVRYRDASQLKSKMTSDEAAELLIASVRRQIEALLNSGRKIALALTAGRDSRMVLAAARPFAKDVTCFTLIKPHGPDVDAEIARMITESCGLRHLELPMLTSKPEERAAYFGRGGYLIGGANAGIFPSMRPIAEDYVFVGGTGGELARGVSLRPEDPGYGKLDAKSILKRLGLPADPRLVSAMELWKDSVPAEGRIDFMDTAFIEHRQGCWASPQFACDPTLVRYQPLTSLDSTRAMASISLADKLSSELPSRVIAQSWPELGQFPSNTLGRRRDWTNQLLRILQDPDAILRKLRKLSA